VETMFKNDYKNYLLVTAFDEEDWSELLKSEPYGYSWREEAFLAGDDYYEEGKEFLRSN